METKRINLEGIIIGTLVIMITSVIFLNVISRYFFSSSFSWAEEVSRYAMVWVTFLGAAYCVKERSNINIDLLSSLLSPKLRHINELAVNFLSSVACLAITYYAFLTTLKIYNSGQKTLAMGIPMYVVYSAIFFGYFFMFIRYFRNMITK